MSDFEPEVQRRELPAEVARLRFIVRAQQAELDAHMQPLLDSHIEVYAAAIETLITTHRELADGTDFDLAGDTRWAAMWLLAGRCRLPGPALHRATLSALTSDRLPAQRDRVVILGRVLYKRGCGSGCSGSSDG